MKRLILLVALILGLGSLAFAQNDSLLIDDFEIPVSGGADGTMSFGASNGSSVKVTSAADTKYWNNLSIKVEFKAVPKGHIYIARGSGLDAKNAGWLVAPDKIDWKKYNAISFYIYGDNANTSIAVDLKDNGGEIWRYIVIDNFKGWQQVVCPFKNFIARSDWQPDTAVRNGVLDFPLQSYQLEPLPPASGVLYFDKVELKKI